MVKTKACKQFRTAYISENPGQEKGIPFLVQYMYDCYPLFQTLWWYILLNVNSLNENQTINTLNYPEKKRSFRNYWQSREAQVFLTGHKYSHKTNWPTTF